MRTQRLLQRRAGTLHRQRSEYVPVGGGRRAAGMGWTVYSMHEPGVSGDGAVCAVVWRWGWFVVVAVCGGLRRFVAVAVVWWHHTCQRGIPSAPPPRAPPHPERGNRSLVARRTHPAARPAERRGGKFDASQGQCTPTCRQAHGGV